MMTLKLPTWIAHRGAPLSAPENTLAALREAKRKGAAWVEFDVQLTQDHHAIIFHDDYLERTTNGHGKISDTSYKIISVLDAGSWFNEKFKGEPVPTLAAYLQCAADLKLGINVELKGSREQARPLAKVTIDTLNRTWPNNLPTPLISSSSIACLEAVRLLAPDSLLGYIMHEWQNDWCDLVHQINVISLHIEYTQLNAERVNAIKKDGKLVLSYTVNDAALAQKLFEMGVDAVFTDNPKLFS